MRVGYNIYIAFVEYLNNKVIDNSNAILKYIYIIKIVESWSFFRAFRPIS